MGTSARPDAGLLEHSIHGELFEQPRRDRDEHVDHIDRAGPRANRSEPSASASVCFQPYSCGAIDLPSSGDQRQLHRQHFSVDGNDYAIGATTPTSGSTATLGISTRTQTDANTVIDALSNGQQDNVAGTPVANQVASVARAPDRPRRACGQHRTDDPQSAVPARGLFVWGQRQRQRHPRYGRRTADHPLHGDTTIKGNGNASGAGILIVDGGLTIQGSLEFTGLIIVLGTTQITTVTGNATVYGAIWTTDLSLSVGGSAAVRYSSPSLALANSIPGVTQKLLPQKVQVLAWSQG